MSPDTVPEPPAIEANGLTVRFRRRGEAEICAVNGVDFSLARGQVMTILGESGSGKSVSLKAVMGLLPPFARVEGQIRIAGRDILSMPPAELAKLRGRQVSMIFQEPMAAMDPVYTIGQQIAETIVQHEGTDEATAMARARQLLDRVAIPSAARRLKNYPHEMSGGMRQRAMIALALACNPPVLLADEPTTALDVTVQIQILMLLRELQSELGMAVVFVTHDVGVAAEISDRIAVMYAGRFVEAGTVRDIMRAPQHPYTRGLLASTVHGGMRRQELRTIPGNPPSLASLPAGCHFRPRCPDAVSRCVEEPPLVSPRPGAMVRCVHAERAARAADAVPA